MGINQWLAGLFSAVACVPISGTAGFMATTNIVTRLPFILGSVIIMGLSLFPQLTAFFASVPAPVGFATLFLPFANMIGMGLKEYVSVSPGEREYLIIGFSLMIGIGTMAIPASALQGLPSLLLPVANNGLVLGTLTAILLEQAFHFYDRKQQAILS